VPELVNWVNTALVNEGVPVALLCTDQFSKLKNRTERQSGWSGEQLQRRTFRYRKLADKPSLEDVEAVTRMHLSCAWNKDEGVWVPTSEACDEKSVSILARYSLERDTPFDCAFGCIEEARLYALKDGRCRASRADLATALKDGQMPSDENLIRAFDPAPAERRGGRNSGGRSNSGKPSKPYVSQAAGARTTTTALESPPSRALTLEPKKRLLDQGITFNKKEGRLETLKPKTDIFGMPTHEYETVDAALDLKAQVQAEQEKAQRLRATANEQMPEGFDSDKQQDWQRAHEQTVRQADAAEEKLRADSLRLGAILEDFQAIKQGVATSEKITPESLQKQQDALTEQLQKLQVATQVALAKGKMAEEAIQQFKQDGAQRGIDLDAAAKAAAQKKAHDELEKRESVRYAERQAYQQVIDNPTATDDQKAAAHAQQLRIEEASKQDQLDHAKELGLPDAEQTKLRADIRRRRMGNGDCQRGAYSRSHRQTEYAEAPADPWHLVSGRRFRIRLWPARSG
jgi:hypothetical protein